MEYVTYENLVQIGLLIVAIIGLAHKINSDYQNKK